MAGASGYDPWFVDQMAALIAIEQDLAQHGIDDLPRELLLEAKQNGFSDANIARLLRADHRLDGSRDHWRRE